MEQKVIFIDLLPGVARLGNYELEILMPGYADGNCFVPAQSVTILSEASLLALRNALLETFPLETYPLT